MTLRSCLECGRPCIGNRCLQHMKPKHYSSQHWQRTRRARLDMDSHRCTLRYPLCTGTATTVHLHPSLQGDHSKATIDNTQSACRHCHGVEDGPRANGYGATSASIRPASPGTA